MSSLENLIKTKKAKVAIIGMGYVGLPHAISIAKAGFFVSGIDIKKNKVEDLNKGKSYIDDVKSEDLKEIINSRKFQAFNDFESLKKADIVIICVPTPLDKYKVPDISYIQNSAEEIRRRLHKNELIVLESTTYPGTTEEVLLPLFEKNGFKVGRDFYLVFAPERIDPGKHSSVAEITFAPEMRHSEIPKVVGGVTEKCRKLAILFYQNFIEKVHSVSSPKIAEMTKLLENTFRLANISMINEFSLLCDKMKIDIWEVIEAAKTKPYGFMPFYPSPKVGGHCAPLDPFYLSFKGKEYNFSTRFIGLAGEINEQMPHFVVTKVISALNKKKRPMNGSKILVWGVSYKKDVGDIRESAALEIIPDILKKGAKVDYFDPYVPKLRIGNNLLKSIKYQPKILRNYDCILILTDHSDFNYNEIAKNSKVVVDTRNAIKSRKYKNIYRFGA